MSSLFSDDAPRLTLPKLGYVERYNNIRLKSAVGYVSLMDMLAAASRRSTGSGTEVGRFQATAADTLAASRMNERPRSRTGSCKHSAQFLCARRFFSESGTELWLRIVEGILSRNDQTACRRVQCELR